MGSYDRPLFATCAECGQVLRNTPSSWDRHVCTDSGLLTMRGMRELKDGLTNSVAGFQDKIRPGGVGRQYVRASVLECALIDLHTDLTRWQEFAEWEAANG